MFKRWLEKRNWVDEYYFKNVLSNLPGIDNSKVIRSNPIVMREDGYVPPSEPMAKWKWHLLHFIAFFLPIRRFGKKYNPHRRDPFKD